MSVRKRKPLQIALAIVLFAFVGVPLIGVAVHRFLPPPPTVLVIERMFQGKGFERHWRPIEKISPNLVYSVIAAEDAKFCSHHGFDFNAMEKALAHNEKRPNKIRGGSTISQQTAKNVFLWPGRSFVRKGFEAWYTFLIEGIWGKRRIMEMYLNVVEWGPGIYGAQAASQHWFHVDADKLSPAQANRLAAILPSPLKWKAAKPGSYVRKRSGKIGKNVGVVRNDDLAECVLH